jgi:hypothetical protein
MRKRLFLQLKATSMFLTSKIQAEENQSGLEILTVLAAISFSLKIEQRCFLQQRHLQPSLSAAAD